VPAAARAALRGETRAAMPAAEIGQARSRSVRIS
jgi:hypothetical protein